MRPAGGEEERKEDVLLIKELDVRRDPAPARGQEWRVKRRSGGTVSRI